MRVLCCFLDLLISEGNRLAKTGIPCRYTLGELCQQAANLALVPKYYVVRVQPRCEAKHIQTILQQVAPHIFGPAVERLPDSIEEVNVAEGLSEDLWLPDQGPQCEGGRGVHQILSTAHEQFVKCRKALATNDQDQVGRT